MNRKKEITVTNKLIKGLKQKGFQINRYNAYGTKSIYLKIDYGVCCGIRISDHKGKKKYRYKFNMINKYNGPKKINDRGYIRFFYDYNKTDEAIRDIQNERESKIKNYGLCNYQKYMKQNSQDKLYKSFKNVT